MATKRSPILGYNHNFRHRGRVFHVQTEDSGVDNPHVFTHLFHGGVIISSRKLDYDRESSEESVKALMQAQHKAMLRDLKRGTFDEKIVSYLGPHPDGALDQPSGHVPAVSVDADADDDAPEIELVADTEPTPAPRPAAAPTPRVAPAFEPPPVTVEFSKPAAAVAVEAAVEMSAPVQIHQPMPEPAAPGVVHSPAPPSAPTPPGSSSYIQRGNVRREAPLFNTGQMAAVLEPGDVRSQHGDRETGPQRAEPAAQQRAQPTPPPTPSAEPPLRPARLPERAPQPTPQPREASTRRTAARAGTQPREQGGSGVVVSRPSVIVGAPPKVVGGDAGRPAAAPARAARSTSTPPQSRPVRSRARAAREESPPDSLFGSDLISEKSLDEVILAYLSEDPSDD